ncbi:MAG: MBL fold metallo-hydrolase [Myxococcaceae bacterium]|nr:MBL fold metallo-hydrolase [Myxococcaceae bacterium]
MELKFWGVRGSVATSGAHVARIGGNTSCLEVTHGEHRLILDAGTGLRGLGDALAPRGPVTATVLFSHLHWDHVQGFPFFAPAWMPSSRLELLGPGANGEQALRDVLDRQMTPPTFPVPLAAMRSQLTFGSAQPGQAFERGPFRITPFEVPHPNGCLGYRIESGGQAIVYMTDVELDAQALAPSVGQAMEGANLLVLDAQYTREEYEGLKGPCKKGWGHSTVTDAALVAKATGAERLFLFHHDPARTDDQVEDLVELARAHHRPTEAAREGKRVVL